MHPYLFSLTGRQIPAYPVLYGLGIAVGGLLVVILGYRRGLDVRRLAHLILLCSVFILVGGRLAYVLQYREQFENDKAIAFDLAEGGQVLYGGLLLAVPSVILTIRMLKLPMAATTDLVAVGAPLGLAVGRLACLCRGCCYGKISDLAWAIRYPRHVDLAGHLVGPPAFLDQTQQGLLAPTADCALPVHPAPVYESLSQLAVFFIMLWLWRTKRFSGRLIIVYPVAYAVARFGLDFAREYKMAFWGMTVSQVVSIAVFTLGLGILVVTRRGSYHLVQPTNSQTGVLDKGV